MKKIKVFCSWALELDIENEKQIEFYVEFHGFPNTEKPSDTIRFILLNEPPEIHNLTSTAIEQQNNYDYLLTHNQELLDIIPHSINFGCGETWIRDYQFVEKIFSVSTVVGSKKMTSNHGLRQDLWLRQLDINVPTDFFKSKNGPPIPTLKDNKTLMDSKNPLFDSQFHICIENATRKNLFTEKLIDCFVTKTIPVYLGCPNIGDWFDLNGIIQVNSIEEIITECNKLTDSTYEKMKPFVEKNFEISKNFLTKKDRIEKLIKSLLNEQS